MKNDRLNCGLTVNELNNIELSEFYSGFELNTKLIAAQIANKILFTIRFQEKERNGEQIEEGAILFDQTDFDKNNCPDATLSFKPLFCRPHAINKIKANELLSKINKNGILISDLSYDDFYERYYNFKEETTIYETN